jgi:hypothetical protein
VRTRQRINAHNTSIESLRGRKHLFDLDVKGKSEVNVKYLCLTKHDAMKLYWVSEGIALRIL